jgi:hypothetical protein
MKIPGIPDSWNGVAISTKGKIKNQEFKMNLIIF